MAGGIKKIYASDELIKTNRVKISVIIASLWHQRAKIILCRLYKL